MPFVIIARHSPIRLFLTCSCPNNMKPIRNCDFGVEEGATQLSSSNNDIDSYGNLLSTYGIILVSIGFTLIQL